MPSEILRISWQERTAVVLYASFYVCVRNLMESYIILDIRVCFIFDAWTIKPHIYKFVTKMKHIRRDIFDSFRNLKVKQRKY